MPSVDSNYSWEILCLLQQYFCLDADYQDFENAIDSRYGVGKYPLKDGNNNEYLFKNTPDSWCVEPVSADLSSSNRPAADVDRVNVELKVLLSESRRLKPCSICGQGFKKPVTLQQHVEKFHPGLGI